MKNLIGTTALAKALASMFDHTGSYKASGWRNKRKPRHCLNSNCDKMTDHKGGYCSSKCARGCL